MKNTETKTSQLGTAAGVDSALMGRVDLATHGSNPLCLCCLIYKMGTLPFQMS